MPKVKIEDVLKENIKLKKQIKEISESDSILEKALKGRDMATIKKSDEEIADLQNAIKEQTDAAIKEIEANVNLKKEIKGLKAQIKPVHEVEEEWKTKICEMEANVSASWNEKYNKLEQDNRTLKATLTTEQSIEKKLEDFIKERDEEIKTLEEGIANCVGVKKMQTKQIKDRDKEIERLEEIKLEQTEKLTEAFQKSIKVQKEIDEKDEEINDLRAKVDDLERVNKGELEIVDSMDTILKTNRPKVYRVKLKKEMQIKTHEQEVKEFDEEEDKWLKEKQNEHKSTANGQTN